MGTILNMTQIIKMATIFQMVTICKLTVSHSCHETHYTGIDSVVQRSQLYFVLRGLSGHIPNFFAKNNLNNARCWLSIHLRDTLTFEKHHPEVANEFQSGNFVVQKSCGNFPVTAIDQALEQTNTVKKRWRGSNWCDRGCISPQKVDGWWPWSQSFSFWIWSSIRG